MRPCMSLNILILGMFFLAMHSESKPVMHPKQLKRPLYHGSSQWHQPQGRHSGHRLHNLKYEPHHHQAYEAHNPDEEQAQRDKREYKEISGTSASAGHGITGPIHSFVKTDRANYKWGVRHHIGPKFT